MASGENAILCKTFEANGDLSDYQYRWVKLESAGTVAICGNGEVPVGILQNDPDDGEQANVMLMGISNLVAHASISVNETIGSQANGRGVAVSADTNSYNAVALEEAADQDDEIKVLLTNGVQYIST
jgi:hypothetical protein